MCPHTTIYVSWYYYIYVSWYWRAAPSAPEGANKYHIHRTYLHTHTHTNIWGEQLLRHPNNTEYTTEYTSICVLILLYICVLILESSSFGTPTIPNTPPNILLYMSSYYYICVLILYMCADNGEQLLRHPNIVAYFGVQRHSGVSVH